MTFKRNIPVDIEQTLNVLAEHQRTKRPPDRSWLGHEQGNGQIDIRLVGGATIEELVRVSGRVPSAVNAHLYHLRKEHGLKIERTGELLRFSSTQTNETTNLHTTQEAKKRGHDKLNTFTMSHDASEGALSDEPEASILKEMRQLQKRVAIRLDAIHARLSAIDNERAALIEERRTLMSFVNGERQTNDRAAPPSRQPRGVLKDACLEAIDASPDGFTSSEVVAWLEKKRPDIMPKAAPTVLSRLATDGKIYRDARGIYRRANKK